MVNETETTIDTEFTVEAGAELSVQNVSGRITVRTGDEGVIRLHAVKDGSAFAMEQTLIDIHQEGNRVELRTANTATGVFDRVRRSLCSVYYELTVPPGTTVSARGVSATIEVEDTFAPLSLESVSGDMRAGGIREYCSVRTVSGDVRLGALAGELTVHTTSGDTVVEDAQLTGYNLHSVSGDFVLHTSLTPGGHYHARTVSGDLRLYVPAGTGATLQLKTVSGEVTTDAPARILRSGRRNWQGVIGDGSAHLELSSVSGDLHLSAPDGEVAPAPAPEPPRDRAETTAVLAALQAGEIDVDEAMAQLGRTRR